jgi:hypothetical protein
MIDMRLIATAWGAPHIQSTLFLSCPITKAHGTRRPRRIRWNAHAHAKAKPKNVATWRPTDATAMHRESR